MLNKLIYKNPEIVRHNKLYFLLLSTYSGFYMIYDFKFIVNLKGIIYMPALKKQNSSC
jgi:hypothetical protein